ncbi:ParA family protein [filamentous cyanobacterium LEGE 11480]|uniref:ParA family protein n=1 Tax=Romeriopsis navalis LEGE 11480 TaxID=2777977 RepID=A0A928VKA2_9CYAN|nr:ParA family protein [Romeriopsis navalis]MBE9030141.1 ParA family protein [Romeriopsis navalis LEGE 11480]
MAFVIATTNMKGGVGKTTMTVNLAASLAKDQNKRVLIVDLDTQISATLSLMPPGEFAKLRADKRSLRYLIHRAILSDPDLFNQARDTICNYRCNVPGLSLLPGDIDLYDEFLVSEMLHRRAVQQGEMDFEAVWNGFERNLVRSILNTVHSEYDIIILDCAPGYNLITRSALLASDFYLIPARPEPLSLIGIQLLERRIARLKEAHKADPSVNLQMLGIVFSVSNNFLTGRYYKQVMKRLNDDFSHTKLFNVRIPMDVNVSKAVDSFTPVVLSNPKCPGGKAFKQLGEEFMQKLNVLARVNEPASKFALTNLGD